MLSIWLLAICCDKRTSLANVVCDHLLYVTPTQPIILTHYFFLYVYRAPPLENLRWSERVRVLEFPSIDQHIHVGVYKGEGKGEEEEVF